MIFKGLWLFPGPGTTNLFTTPLTDMSTVSFKIVPENISIKTL